MTTDMKNANKKTRAIKFANVGRKKQHEVTLFGFGERPFDIKKSLCQQNSYAMETIQHCYDQAIAVLTKNGINEIEENNLYHVVDGKVVPWPPETGHPMDGMPLVAAIQERDKEKGQTDDYLAALIVYHANILHIALFEPNPPHDFILDTCLLIQDTFFRLILLANVQAQYSAGVARTHEANSAINLRSRFEQEAEQIYRKYREKFSKNKSYELTAKQLHKKYPNERTPKAGSDLTGDFRSKLIENINLIERRLICLGSHLPLKSSLPS
jgi:hypothetical protein